MRTTPGCRPSLRRLLLAPTEHPAQLRQDVLALLRLNPVLTQGKPRDRDLGEGSHDCSDHQAECSRLDELKNSFHALYFLRGSRPTHGSRMAAQIVTAG